jgi:type I restriction enzyme S subunit
MPGKFFAAYLRSPEFVNYVESVQTGIAYPAINDKQFFSGVIPVPPLAEQHRIVAKVDELMALCDQLEQQQTDSNSAHQTMVEALLDTLNSAVNQGEFAEAWQRIANHFDTLFTTEHSIDQLKQNILQLAVVGKLVPQNPNDEPASVLLEQIANEKARLVKDGKIKKEDLLPKISEDEKPFELPDGWEWTRLGNLSSNIHYGYTASAKQEKKGVRLLRITDIQNDAVNWETVPSCDIEDDKVGYYQLENDDVLIARTGGTIGKSYLVDNINVVAVFASYLIRIKRIDGMYSSFIKTFLGSQLYWQQLYANSMGTGQPNVNATALKGLTFPLPPIAEQRRIVAKVDELITLCDNLKARLNDAQVIQSRLADAIVEDAVA